MLPLEKKWIEWCDRNKIWLFAIAITVLSAFLRLSGLDFRSEDYRVWLKPWFDEIQAKGGLAAVTEQVGDYNVLYQFLIALMTYLPLHPLSLYKGLSCAFDYLLAICAALIVQDLTKDRIRSIVCYAAVLLAPTIFIDSAFWGQCDSIYCFFLLSAVYCLMRKKELLAFIMIAVAFQFKLQTILILPFLLYYYVISKRFSLLHFAIIPLMSILVCLLFGRGPFDTFKIYLSQTSAYEYMSFNFPSIWNLIGTHYNYLHIAAILITISLLGIGLLLVMHVKPEPNGQNIFNTLILSFWTCLLVLPAMHDRYAYFLIILLLIVAAVRPAMAGYWLVCELTVLSCYCKFLWNHMALARIPEYISSCVFVCAYFLFLYQCVIQNKDWVPQGMKRE